MSDKKRLTTFKLGEAQISLDAELGKKQIEYLDWVLETRHEDRELSINISNDFVELLLKLKRINNESKE